MTLAIGGNVHLSYTSTVYGTNRDGVMAAVDDLGFVVLRENSAEGVATLKAHFGGRVKILGVAGNGLVATAMLKAGVDYLEGPNELFTKKDLTVPAPTATNPKATRKMTQQERADNAIKFWNQVYDAREAYFAETGIRVPLLSPSAALGDAADALAVAKLMGLLTKQPDIQSIHCYPGNRTVADFITLLRTAKAVADVLAPGKPRWLTETGSWWDGDAAIRSAASHHPTAPDDAKRLWPLYYDAIEAEGFIVALMYETADEAGTDRYHRKALQEGRLGVLDLDLSDKAWTPVIRAEAHRRNGFTPPSAPVDPTSWAVAITPDPTNRIKAVQQGLGITADGLWGNDSLSAVERLLTQHQTLQASYAALDQKALGVAVSLDAASATLKGS